MTNHLAWITREHYLTCRGDDYTCLCGELMGETDPISEIRDHQIDLAYNAGHKDRSSAKGAGMTVAVRATHNKSWDIPRLGLTFSGPHDCGNTTEPEVHILVDPRDEYPQGWFKVSELLAAIAAVMPEKFDD